MNYEFHEAANLFPLDEEHLGELAEDIKANGLKVPVELLEGKILDGRRRIAACKIAGVLPRFSELNVGLVPDPVAHVLSLNLHRRQLTPSQRSMVGARARDIFDKAAKERQQMSLKKGDRPVPVKVPERGSGDSRDLAGKAVGVSGKLIDTASRVLKHAEPAIIKAVDDGKMAVGTAAEIALEPPEVQRAEAEKPKRTYNSVSKPLKDSVPAPNESEEEIERDIKGVGIVRANEAINCLTRIPKNDALRKRGFQLVTDWIRSNK